MAHPDAIRSYLANGAPLDPGEYHVPGAQAINERFSEQGSNDLPPRRYRLTGLPRSIESLV
jgi:hypothetical protein